jgi:hypothetical protein
MKEPATLSVAEVALATGFSRQAVHRAVRDGRLNRHLIRDAKGRARLVPEAVTAIRSGLLRLRADSAAGHTPAPPPARDEDETPLAAELAFWVEHGRIADPEAPPLSTDAFWGEVAAMLSGLMDEQYDGATVRELAYQLATLPQAVAAGARWDQDRWDEANTRSLLADLPCPVAVEMLRDRLSAGRVPDALKDLVVRRLLEGEL